MTITGGCGCGAVRYTIEAERITARHCWCRDCQYIGAGSGTVNVFFPSEAVNVNGALSDYTSRAASGNLMHRQFCPTCGTPMFTQSQARLHLIGVRKKLQAAEKRIKELELEVAAMRAEIDSLFALSDGGGRAECNAIPSPVKQLKAPLCWML
jgi:hypothetical protein